MSGVPKNRYIRSQDGLTIIRPTFARGCANGSSKGFSREHRGPELRHVSTPVLSFSP